VSYAKLFLTCQDHAVGLQSVNQAMDNQDALYAAIDSKHSLGVGGDSPYGQPTRALGRHDDILIARTVAHFSVDATPVVPRLAMSVGGPVLGNLAYVRLAVGQWRIYLSTPQLFGAVALMQSSASVDYKANCLTSYDPATGHFVTVTTWNIAGGPIALDLPFSLVLWTQFS
jgi:hypothetical protein